MQRTLVQAFTGSGNAVQKTTTNYALPYNLPTSVSDIVEGDIYDDVLQETFLFLDDTTLLQMRIVCKRWKSYVSRITPKLCALHEMPVTNTFFHYCLCKGRVGPYAQWFNDDPLHIILKALEDKEESALLSEHCTYFLENWDSLFRHINRIITEEKFSRIIAPLQEALIKFGTIDNQLFLNLALQIGNPHLISHFWSEEHLAPKNEILTSVSRFGSLAVLYSVDISYPQFEYYEHVPMSWILEASQDESLVPMLLRAAFNSDRLDICEQILDQNPNLRLQASITTGYTTDRTLRWFCEYGTFDLPTETGGIALLRAMNGGTTQTTLLKNACDIPDLQVTSLKLLHNKLNNTAFVADCFSSLIRNKNFACLAYAIATTETYNCTCLGEAKLIACYNANYSPLQELDNCLHKAHVRLLDLLLEEYRERIDWKLLLNNLKKKSAVSPSVVMCVIAAEAGRDNIDLQGRWN